MLVNYCENFLLIEECMSEFVEFIDVLLIFLKNKCWIEVEIIKLEKKLGG